jgi:peptidoglycan/LPS O-acetylase OafA/YrhL
MGALRPEIQALRALAVSLVVVFHLWPAALPGGFIGVDVFFVISGFLITALLLREIDGTGTVSLSRFWARRARRILPAALFTLLCCLVATIVLVPINLWPQLLGELLASTAYVQNWHLASQTVDYFAVAERTESPVQHFWSLALEEQFYLVWPVLLWLVAPRRRVLMAVGAGVTTASVIYALVATSANPAAAYFLTPARAWEFGAGALLALAGDRARPSPALCRLGLAMIVAGALAITAKTPFPGWAAFVPVLGAVAVIRARAATPVLAWRPVQFLGDISYSVYLWHWPLLVFAPYVIGAEPDALSRTVILMLTLLLAWLSKRAIEDPVRGAPLRPSRTFAVAGAATLLLIVPIAGSAAHVDEQRRDAEQLTQAVLAAQPACFGAAAMDPELDCENPQLRLSVVPTPIEARTMAMGPCRDIKPMLGKRVCEFGVPASEAQAGVALVGDSHAGMWRVVLDSIATTRRWHGTHMGHASCPLSLAVRDIPEPSRSSCNRWRKLVFSWFRARPEVTTLFVAQLSGGSGVLKRRGQSQLDAQIKGYQRAWADLPPTVTRIVVIRDTPKVERGTASCVQRSMDARRPAGPACAVPRREAIDRDPAADAAARLDSPRVATIDLNRFLCDTRRCHPVIGGALVYKDTTHLLEPFMRSLTPYFQRELEPLVN